MGASSSKTHKSSGQVLSTKPVQSQQKPPYHGIPCDYHFIRIDIPFSIKMNLSFLSNPDMQMATSDTNAYVPHLCEMYNLGYRLLSFQMTPGSVTSASGFMSVNNTTILRAQAIFRKNEPKLRSDEMYRLEVIKSSIESGTFLTRVNLFSGSATHTQTHTQHLYQMIHDHACRGGRLRCIEITGCYRPAHLHNPHSMQTMGVGSGMGYDGTMHSRSAIYGVDLFFEMPLHPSPALFQYQSVPLKMTANLNVSMGFPSPTQNWVLQLDWLGVMTQFLGSGWRLVEVFNDMSTDASTDMAGFGSTTSTMVLNIIFIFEKPESRLDDNNPVYEGTMIEYNARGTVQAGFGSSTTVIDTNWDSVIGSMGADGWELITVLQTPAVTTDMKFMGVSTNNLMWMFFQRAIVSSPESKLGGMEPPPPVLPEYSP